MANMDITTNYSTFMEEVQEILFFVHSFLSTTNDFTRSEYNECEKKIYLCNKSRSLTHERL